MFAWKFSDFSYLELKITSLDTVVLGRSLLKAKHDVNFTIIAHECFHKNSCGGEESNNNKKSVFGRREFSNFVFFLVFFSFHSRKAKKIHPKKYFSEQTKVDYEKLWTIVINTWRIYSCSRRSDHQR